MAAHAVFRHCYVTLHGLSPVHHRRLEMELCRAVFDGGSEEPRGARNPFGGDLELQNLGESAGG